MAEEKAEEKKEQAQEKPQASEKAPEKKAEKTEAKAEKAEAQEEKAPKVEKEEKPQGEKTRKISQMTLAEVEAELKKVKDQMGGYQSRFACHLLSRQKELQAP